MAEGRRINLEHAFPNFWHNHPWMNFPFHHRHDGPNHGGLFNQNFGQGFADDEILIGPHGYPMRSHPSHHHRQSDGHNFNQWGGYSTEMVVNDKFRVSMDVAHFTPEELEVRVVEDTVVVQGSHEEKMDEHGLISRKFCRRYKIPDNVNLDGIAVSVSHDGVLSVSAPLKRMEPSTERKIPILVQKKPTAEKNEQE